MLSDSTAPKALLERLPLLKGGWLSCMSSNWKNASLKACFHPHGFFDANNDIGMFGRAKGWTALSKLTVSTIWLGQDVASENNDCQSAI